MSVRIKWLNRNADYESITVYRDTKVIDPNTLPASLAVLTGGEVDYLDTTAPVKTLLYYLIALKKGDEVTYSLPKPTVNIGYTGPGPQNILYGDWRFGYFGAVPAADLFTAPEVCTPLTVAGVNSASGLVWHKFAHKGKVLYFPSQHLSTTVGWNYLYNKGLVFGIDGDGPTGHSNTPTNQMKKVTRGDDQFIVRLPRCNNTPGFVAGTTELGNIDAAEFALIVSANYNTTGAANPILGNLMLANVNTQAPMAEFSAGALNAGCSHMNANTWTAAALPANNIRSQSNYLWRPVLEYVMR